MKKHHWLILISIAFSFSGCAIIHHKTQPVKKDQFNNTVTLTAKKHYLAINPKYVLLIKKDSSIKTPHKIIGTIQIAHMNQVGVKRQQAVINDLMQKYAASMGGNAVVNIQQKKSYDTGQVIRLIT